MKAKQHSSLRRVLCPRTLITLAIIVLFGCSQKALAQQWTTTGNDISNTNSGNVGIGTSAPSAKLDLTSTAAGTVTVKIKGAASQTGNLLEFRASDNSLRSYVNPAGALFFNPAMDQVAAAITIAPNFNGQYYATAEHNTFTIDGANMAQYGLYTNPAVRMFQIKDVNGFRAVEVNKLGMMTLRGDMSNRGWITNVYVDSSNAYYAGDADGLLISGTGLGNHGLYSGGNVRMLRVVGTGEALAVTRYNLTGFGTLNPAARVDILGTGSTSATASLSVKNSGSTSLLFVRDDGNVGVGTGTPGYKFDVGGQINSSGGLCIAGDCKTAWSQVGGGSSQWTTVGTVIHYSSGNVGVGTSTPVFDANAGAKYFTVNAGSGAIGSVGAAGGTGSTGTAVGQVAFVNSSLGTTEKRLATIVGSTDTATNSGNLDFWTASAGAFSAPRIRITSTGNVGIGTTSPGSKLFVGSGTPAVQTLAGLNVALGGASYVSASNGTENIFMGADGSGYGILGTLSNHSLGFRTNNSERVRIDTSGNVGIGTTAPIAKLHVAGDGKVTGNLTVDGNIAAKYQDVAEWVPAARALPPGTVVTLNRSQSNLVEASSKAYDTRVAGVISAQPGIALGEQSENKVLVATTGRVRIKVDATNGPIEIGDLLVTSEIEGFAMKSVAVNIGGIWIHRPGTIIGKALEPLANGTGEILVLLSLQ